MTAIEERPTDQGDARYEELSYDEWHAGALAALEELGLTYAELKEQARNRDFSSAQAHALWSLIGGTLDL
ncbi:hypothetical protein ACWD4O_25645 [Streptomyces sp. NPDC002623]|uniref:Uncharacterized protein n=1 Tax=Streptomyces doebereineriae TaxID=3075528 RepID=A0ABU2V2I2_9ACTN|nr:MULTISPECIES: hypothetical protein [Streptomyces]MDO0935229.1 hypothetical protein [Streptomyces sp. DG2A-72]MDT0479753.1 hypothetical protein [Streptomyces sp. DSM 41640]WFB87971.1 hypothetical protein MMU79_34265 [Streptomyces olivaceus]WGK47574.1 hypothetical protein M6G09_19375 [Streptomyces sp. B146]